MSEKPFLPRATTLGLLGSLYFSQGLPFGFFTQSLPVLLRKEGYSLGAIGLSSLLALPWGLKFLWAPLVDRFSWSQLGRRSSWIVPLQLASVAVLSMLAALPRAGSTTTLLAAVFVLNLFAATQDIATDALAVDVLEPTERGLANGLQVAGYRVGMIVGGGLLLVLADTLGRPVTFVAMAALTALSTLPIVMAGEPRGVPDVQRPVGGVHFLRRPGAARLLALVVSYKLGDAFATSMLRPFLADRGMSLRDIGWLLGTVGFVAGLAGALSGGLLVNRFGRRASLTLFGFFQSAAIAGYGYVALGEGRFGVLYAVVGVEHFASGMATAALFTHMMDRCSRETSATDYTVQASAVVAATGLASAVAGFSASALGYAGHFFVASTLSLVALLAVRRSFARSDGAGRAIARETEVPGCA